MEKETLEQRVMPMKNDVASLQEKWAIKINLKEKLQGKKNIPWFSREKKVLAQEYKSIPQGS